MAPYRCCLILYPRKGREGEREGHEGGINTDRQIIRQSRQVRRQADRQVDQQTDRTDRQVGKQAKLRRCNIADQTSQPYKQHQTRPRRRRRRNYKKTKQARRINNASSTRGGGGSRRRQGWRGYVMECEGAGQTFPSIAGRSWRQREAATGRSGSGAGRLTPPSSSCEGRAPATPVEACAALPRATWRVTAVERCIG